MFVFKSSSGAAVVMTQSEGAIVAAFAFSPLDHEWGGVLFQHRRTQDAKPRKSEPIHKVR